MAGVDEAVVGMESPEPATATKDGVKKTTPRSKSASNKRKPTPTTVPKPFNLGLNKRIEERKGFQADFEKRQQEAEKRELARKEEQEEEDKKALKEYRKSLVFKATPVKRYRDVTINPSEKELTCPMAPPLRTSSGSARSRRRSGGSEGGSSADDGGRSSYNSPPIPPAVTEAAPA